MPDVSHVAVPKQNYFRKNYFRKRKLMRCLPVPVSYTHLTPPTTPYV